MRTPLWRHPYTSTLGFWGGGVYMKKLKAVIKCGVLQITPSINSCAKGWGFISDAGFGSLPSMEVKFLF